MTPGRLVPPEELHQLLRALKCLPTGTRTQTGEFWKTPEGQAFQVPDPDELSGCYSDWIVPGIVEDAGGAPATDSEFH